MTIKFEQARQARILNLLIQSAQPLTSQYFASYFNISQRLIRYDIQHLKKSIAPYKCEITSIRGTGYILSGEIQQLQQEMKSQLGELYYYDNIDTKDKFIREQLILRYLLLKNKIVTTKELIEQFYITRATLKEDITRAAETIEPYHMTIHQVPYHGVYLAGTETNKRMLLARETAFYKESPLLSFIQNQLDFISFNIKDILIFVRQEFDITLSNIESYNLYVHIWVMFYRIWQNFLIEEETLFTEHITKKEVELTKNFLKRYIFWVDIPIKEVYYLVLLIQSSGTSKYSMYSEVSAMIEEVSKDTSLFFDTQLITDISHLLYPIIVKSRNQISSNSIMIREIKKTKPLCIDLAYRFIEKVEKKYQIEVFDNDICSIAYLFLNHFSTENFIRNKTIIVTTSVGYLLSKHLLSALTSEFPEIVFEYVELYDIDMYQKDNCILIISDTFIQFTELDVKAIKINLMFTQKDRERIARYIQRSYQHTAKQITDSLSLSLHNDVPSFLKMISETTSFELSWLQQRERKITLETNKSCVIICDYALNSYNFKGWYNEKGIYWKNATIHYFFYINVLHTKKFHYFDLETYITELKESKIIT